MDENPITAFPPWRLTCSMNATAASHVCPVPLFETMTKVLVSTIFMFGIALLFDTGMSLRSGKQICAFTGWTSSSWLQQADSINATMSNAKIEAKLKPRWDVHLSGDDDQLG